MPAEGRVHLRLGAAVARPARPFAWLRESAATRTAVFVPVLLGAGVILSALAFVLERLAGAVAHGTADQRRERSTIGTGEALGAACQATLGSRPEITGVTAVAANHLRIAVEPPLSDLQRRRFFGCLEDATLDFAQARVTNWGTVTLEPEAGPTPSPGGTGHRGGGRPVLRSMPAPTQEATPRGQNRGGRGDGQVR